MNGGKAIVYFQQGGDLDQQNCYSSTDSTLENLVKKSNINQQLLNTGTYRNDVWTDDVKNDNGTWKYNNGYPILKWQL